MYRSRPAGLLLLLFYAVYTLFSILYRVTDQFAFHLTSYVFFALAIPFGFAGMQRQRQIIFSGLVIVQALLTPAFYAGLPRLLRAGGIGDEAFGVPQVGTGARDGLDFYINPNKRGDYGSVEFGRGVLEAMPAGSLVLAQWYTDTDEYFILRYFQVVEGLRPDVEIEGWPADDTFRFDPQLAVDLVDAEILVRPVYLASLSVEFYNAWDIVNRYCVLEENELYRVLQHGEGCRLPENE